MESNQRELALQIERGYEAIQNYADEVQHKSDEQIQGFENGSKVKAEELLATVKGSRLSLSQKTDQGFQDFEQKLPYTRLGSGPFAKAYEFMAEPAVFKTSSQLKKEQLVIQARQTQAKKVLGREELYLIVLGIVICGMGVGMVYRYGVKR